MLMLLWKKADFNSLVECISATGSATNGTELYAEGRRGRVEPQDPEAGPEERAALNGQFRTLANVHDEQALRAGLGAHEERDGRERGRGDRGEADG